MNNDQSVFLFFIGCFVGGMLGFILKILFTGEKKLSDKLPPIPTVAFPFEPLTELVQECANRFEKYPLFQIPKVFISPAASFGNDVNAIFHPTAISIYFKDTYANTATPEELVNMMTECLVHAWLWQHSRTLLNGLKVVPETHKMGFEVAVRLLGLRDKERSEVTGTFN